MTDERGVSWGRYDAEHGALLIRIAALEVRAEELRGQEEMHRALDARVAALEAASHAGQASDRQRRDRLWLIVLGLTTGIVCPLVVTALITLLHIRASRLTR